MLTYSHALSIYLISNEDSFAWLFLSRKSPDIYSIFSYFFSFRHRETLSMPIILAAWVLLPSTLLRTERIYSRSFSSRLLLGSAAWMSGRGKCGLLLRSDGRWCGCISESVAKGQGTFNDIFKFPRIARDNHTPVDGSMPPATCFFVVPSGGEYLARK